MTISNPVFQRASLDYQPRLVAVNYEAIDHLSAPVEVGAMGYVLAGTPMAGRPLLFSAFLVAMDALNYQFWDINAQGGFVRYEHGGKAGALAMQAAFIECWCRHIPAEGPDSQAVACAVEGMKAELAAQGLSGVFGAMPSPDSRLELLQEVLAVERLLSAATFLVARVQNEDQLGWVDAQLLAALFPKSYADDYLKKAQLTLMFIAAEWRAMKCGRNVRLDVSAAADYQLPKVLRGLGLLTYQDDVARVIDGGSLVEAGGEVEGAIRAATIYACQALAIQFNVGVEAVDFWLWQQRNVARDAQFHLTRTTHY